MVILPRTNLQILKTTILTLVLFSNFFAATLTWAWDKTGHRVVGEIAERHLSFQAKKKVKELLNGESLAEAGTWADEIRSDPSWNFAGPWHYVNFPADAQYDNYPKNPNGDIIVKIEQMVTIIRGKTFAKELPTTPNAPDENIPSDNFPNEKQLTPTEALKFLVHLMGDIHQPLHVGYGEDHGGNDVSVTWFKEKTNLHTVWDQHLLEFQKLSFTEWVYFLDIPEKRKVLLPGFSPTGKFETPLKEEIIKWAMESRVYLPLIYRQSTPGKVLGFPYTYEFHPVVSGRMTQAGLRLAKVLNNAFQ
jgi:hypothetical protein